MLLRVLKLTLKGGPVRLNIRNSLSTSTSHSVNPCIIFPLTMKLAQAVIVSIVAAVTANPVPTPTLQDRATTFCGDWDSVTTGYYTVYQNLWGKSAATSGSQCTTLNSGENYGVAWSTSWTWAGGSSSVKSYANAGFTMSARQVSGISSIPSQWYW